MLFSVYNNRDTTLFSVLFVCVPRVHKKKTDGDEQTLQQLDCATWQ